MRYSRRHPTFDYSSPGGYFVMICVDRRNIPTELVAGRGLYGVLASITTPKPELTDLGMVVREQWERLPSRFSHVSLDEYVIMPDHLHGLLWLGSIPGAEKTAPGLGPLRAEAGTKSGSLPAVVQAFKAASAFCARDITSGPGWTAPVTRFWQRNYDEQIIRDKSHLAAVRRYVQNNPRKLFDHITRGRGKG
jgi:putative transposase